MNHLMGKSAAQIRRLQARAAARGGKYVPPTPPEKKNETDPSENAQTGCDDEAKLAAAKKLERALAELESNAGDGGESKLNSKERRSAKRKAEAIAVAESGCATSEELMEWYGKQPNGGGSSNKSTRPKKKAKRGGDGDDDPTSSMSDDDKRRYQIARALHESLAGIEKDDKLNSKERRSAKRKAEAIASEQLPQPDGGPPSSTEELLAWYETVRPTSTEKESGKVSYNVFIGQLAFATTKEGLFGHIQSTLGKELITAESCQIRLLTDTKTKRSRGMAFVTLSSGELRYECLKLHLTYLDGRRINGKSKPSPTIRSKASLRISQRLINNFS